MIKFLYRKLKRSVTLESAPNFPTWIDPSKPTKLKEPLTPSCISASNITSGRNCTPIRQLRYESTNSSMDIQRSGSTILSIQPQPNDLARQQLSRCAVPQQMYIKREGGESELGNATPRKPRIRIPIATSTFFSQNILQKSSRSYCSLNRQRRGSRTSIRNDQRCKFSKRTLRNVLSAG